MTKKLDKSLKKQQEKETANRKEPCVQGNYH